jgi:ketosteroid isomerase-like protein
MAATALAILERLREAVNRHDLGALVACFAPDYRSEQPVHPERAFVGREQVHENWSAIFEDVPGLRAELIRATSDDQVVWAEWLWSGARLDGEQLKLQGVTIMGVADGHIVWGRLYMEPVSVDGRGVGVAPER